MADTIFAAGGIVLVFLITAFSIIRDNRKRERHFFDKLKQSWGKIPEREYTYDELEHIAQFFYQREKKEFFIDDITWNDLDMNRIFILLNQSSSAVGAEVLYDMLRRPVFEKEELQKRHELMEFFTKNESARHQIQKLLSGIKKPGNVSVFEAIHVTKEVRLQGSGMQLLFCAAFFLSLLSFILKPSVGVIVFLAVCVLNIITYMNKKGETDVYLTSFRCVIQLLEAQKALEKCKIRELESFTEEGKQYQKALAGFKRGSSLVVNRSSMGGGLEGTVMDYIRMLTHIDLIKFRDMMKIVQEKQAEIEGLIYLFGYLDCMISAASFRQAVPYYCIPEFADKGRAYLQVEELYHPLISHPVANTICTEKAVLVTGSNASGKSTFLKNIAVNTILAQTVNTCTATCYQAPFYKIMTSMALRDDLLSGESYFIVEIRSLKRILDETKEDGYLLCIIDEVLRGTNTIERIAASSRILANIQRKNVLPFAATHDIELSYILEKIYENYHFEEEVGSKDVIFNYLLKTGRVSTRNAIRLLEMIGYDKSLADSAKRAVKSFEETGIWENIE